MGEGGEFRNSFLLKYRSYCKTLTVKTHQYNRTLYTVAKRIQMLQWNSEFAWQNTWQIPIHLPSWKKKFKTNHTARILIFEIFLNKLSIGQLAQLSLIISPGLQRCWFVKTCCLSPSGLRASEAHSFSISPNHTVPFHRTLPLKTG